MYIEETPSSGETDYRETFTSALHAWHAIRDNLAAADKNSATGPSDTPGNSPDRSLRRVG